MGTSAGLVIGGLGLLTQAGGSLLQANAAKQQGQAEAAAANYDAELALFQSREEGRAKRRSAQVEIGREITRVGASGVRLEGSPLDVIAANAAALERDATNVELAGRRTAALDRQRGVQAKRAGRIGSTSALLSGVSGLARAGSSLLLPGS